MATTLVKTPAAVAYSRQPIEVTIETDQILVNQKAYLILDFSPSGCADGEKLHIGWLNKSVVFTFRAAPNASGLELPTFTGTAFDLYVAFQLRDALRANYYIAEDFMIDNGSPNRLVLSYQNSDAVVFSTNLTTAHNLIITAHNLVSPLLQPNLSAYLRLSDALGNAFGAPLNVPFNLENGRADFDIRTAFSDLSPSLPDATSLNPRVTLAQGIASSSYKTFTIQFGDKYGSPPTVPRLYRSAIFCVVFGTAKQFPNHIGQPAELLHPLASIAKSVALNQPEYVYIFTKETYEFPYIEITLRLADGNTVLYLPSVQVEVYAKQVYYFPTGYQQLGLHHLTMPNNSPIVAYEWRLMDYNTNTFITTELVQINYQLDFTTTEGNLYVLFDNGMGGMESLRLRGSVREKYTVEQTDIEYADGTRDATDEELSLTYDVTTTMIPTHLARHYRHLLRGLIWLCDLSNYQFIPIVRVTKEIEINPNVPYNALKFSFSIAQREL